MINKKGVRPMGELIGAMLISIIIVIVAVSLIFAWFGGFISPYENAINSGRDLAQAIDDLEGSVGLAGYAAIRTCNEFDMAVFPSYRLIVDRDDKTVTSQFCPFNAEGKCDKEDIETIETNKIKSYVSSTSDNVCSPFYFDASAHTTHCYDDHLTFDDFKSDFSGSDYLIINTKWNQKIVGTYCVCAVSDASIPARFAGRGGATWVYPKGLSVTCTKLFDKLVAEPVSKTIGDKIKEPFVSAYERIKDWLNRNFGKKDEVVEEQEGSS